MKVNVTFADGRVVPYESRHEDFLTVFREILAKRYLEINGEFFLTTAVVSVRQ